MAPQVPGTASAACPTQYPWDSGCGPPRQRLLRQQLTARPSQGTRHTVCPGWKRAGAARRAMALRQLHPVTQTVRAASFKLQRLQPVAQQWSQTFDGVRRELPAAAALGLDWGAARDRFQLGIGSSVERPVLGHSLPASCAGMQGHLLELFAASVGLFCPNGLPSDLSGLSALHTLDLSFNAINSTLAQVAQVRVLQALPSDGAIMACQQLTRPGPAG